VKFESLLDGDVPGKEFTFVAILDSTQFGGLNLRWHSANSPTLPLRGKASNTIRNIRIKSGIELPDASNGDELVFTAIKDSEIKGVPIMITKVKRP
jgi:hypothetical protein